MSKFLNDLKCIYEKTTFENLKTNDIFTTKDGSVIGYTKTNKSWKEEIFPGGHWTAGPMGTLVSNDSAPYEPPVYKNNGTGISLINKQEVVFSFKDTVYNVRNPIFLDNPKTTLVARLYSGLADLFESQKNSIFICRNNGICQCERCKNNVGKNFNYCPWCGRKKILIIGG